MSNNQQKEQTVNLDTLRILPIAVVLYDNDSTYFANEKAIELFEAPPQKVKKLREVTLYQFLDSAHHKNVKARVDRLLKGEILPAIQINFTTFKNNQLIIEAKSNRVWYENKFVVQSAFTDVTDSVKRKLELEESKALLQNISNNSLDVIFKMDFFPKNSITYVSESCETVLGFTKDEIYKTPKIIASYLSEADKKYAFTTKEEYLEVSENTKNNKVQLSFKNKKGEYKFLEVVAKPVYDEKNNISGVIGNIRDITERMLTEEKLVEAKAKFDLITINGNDIISFFTYLPKEKYSYVSPNIQKVLGYKPEELLKDPKFFSRKLLSDPKTFKDGESEMAKCQKNGIKANYNHTYKTFKKNGEEVWLENTSTPILDAKGNISFYLNILKDVTEQKLKELEIEKQYNNYRELLDSSPVAYIIHDHGTGVYVNKQLVKLLKVKKVSDLIGRSALDFFDDESKRRATSRIKDIYNHKNTNQFANYNIIDAEGKKIEVEIKSVLVKFDNKECILSLINNLSKRKGMELEKEKMKETASYNLQLQKEIKERKEAEKNLIEKTAHLSSIFESSTHLIWTVNRNYSLTSFNENFARVVKLQHGVDVKLGDKVDEILIKNQETYRDYWYPIYEEAFSGKKLEFEKQDYLDKEVHRLVYINPIYNEHNQIEEISCIANDITDSKIYEKKLINQTAKLTAIFDSSHHYIWTIDREERLTSFNKNYFDIISSLYNTKPYLGLVLNRGVLSNNHEYNKLLKQNYKIAFEGRAVTFEVETLDKNSKKVSLEVFLNPIFDKEKVIEVSGIAHNITDKKQVQQKIELSLKEKEILLREVHHRVKNNMQVVSSILNLQSSYVSDEYALTLLKESQNRIKTMAYIHESLYQNKSFSSVNFSEYVRTLLSNIIHSYSHSKEKIKLDMRVEELILPLDNSIPVGLIINELVTNAIKHAFPGHRQGVITLELKCENNFVFLVLRDNGVGFKDNVSFQNSNSLGLQLVNTLIEQIDGQYKFKSEKDIGTEIQVTFKM